MGQWIRQVRIPVIKQGLIVIHCPLLFCVTLLTGIHLPRGARIKPGLRIWHFGCIVVNPDTVIGYNCTLRHGVTIGTRRADHDVPVLGDDVDVGAGAKILGAITVGNGVAVGANAVVLDDVPDNCIAVGNPARILPRRAGREESPQMRERRSG